MCLFAEEKHLGKKEREREDVVSLLCLSPFIFHQAKDLTQSITLSRLKQL
jgi:hypothetical protein